MSKENGGPAFPLCVEVGENIHLNLGMTLRDYFAAKAMGGLNANPLTETWTSELVATVAYQQADAMLKAREE